MMATMRTLPMSSGTPMPVYGLGTWRMGESAKARAAELAALRRGLELGVTLIDTAEMYGEGGAEEIVGEAIAGQRDATYLVSKVYPHNASRAGVVAACERSLKRLGTDRLDLYLLHWRGSHPLADTVAGFERLQRDGKIRAWGVSNFDTDDMVELAGVAGGAACASNQVLYHLGERGVEFDLLDTCARAKATVMAYSPLGQGPLLRAPVLRAIGDKHGVDPAAIALAALLERPNVCVIPKSTRLEHVAANVRALEVRLDDADRAALAAAFPSPRRKTPLGVL
jgi:diketogulonate reductase-like aldo/keto reductase